MNSRPIGVSWTRAAPVVALALGCALATGADFHHRHQAPPAPTPTTVAGVLEAITAAAPAIHSVSAKAAVDDYTALVDDITHSSGLLYFKRTKQGPMYVLDLTQPPAAAKRLIYRDQTGYIYTPASKQLLKYPLAGKQSLVDEFLLLGMGSTGADLTAAYRIVFDGAAPLDGVPTVKLTLTPLHPEVSSKLTRIDLWYDTRTWIAAQQQIWQLGGDYHRVHFTDVKRDPRLEDSLFTTDFPGSTTIVP